MLCEVHSIDGLKLFLGNFVPGRRAWRHRKTSGILANSCPRCFGADDGADPGTSHSQSLHILQQSSLHLLCFVFICVFKRFGSDSQYIRYLIMSSIGIVIKKVFFSQITTHMSITSCPLFPVYATTEIDRRPISPYVSFAARVNRPYHFSSASLKYFGVNISAKRHRADGLGLTCVGPRLASPQLLSGLLLLSIYPSLCPSFYPGYFFRLSGELRTIQEY